MRTTKTSLYLFFLILVLSVVSDSNIIGQHITIKETASKPDSTRLHQLLLRIDELPIYSLERQAYLDSVLLMIPAAAPLWQQKAMPLFKQRKYELGMGYLDSAVKYDQTRHFLEYRAFIKCIFQKSYKEALKDFDLAIKVNGNSYIMDHPYTFYKGLCYLQLNQFDSAFNFINGCIETSRKKRDQSPHHLHLFYKGVVLFEMGKIPEAIETFNETLKIYPQFSDVLFYQALCLNLMKRKNEALEKLKLCQLYFDQGYTINEDNAIYELYPYQINARLIRNTISLYER